MALPDLLQPDTTPLRVAWFGHFQGRHGNGLAAYSRQTVAAMRARGIEVLFFAHREGPSAAAPRQGVELRALRLKTLTVSLPGSLDRIAAELTRFQPDVVHVSVSFSLLDGALASLAQHRHIPAVATVHLPYGTLHSTRARVLREVYRFQAWRLAHFDAIVALSEGQRALLVESGCDPARIVVIPNAVDTDRFRPGRSRLRSAIKGRFVVVYMGRLDPEKRVPHLVRSFLGQGWGKDHLLLVAGSGTQRRQLQRLSTEHPQVRLLGVISDEEEHVDLLRAADVFVLPSTAEGLSLALLEAMSVGRAVVATSAGEDGAAVGDAGLVIPVSPLEPALSDALRRLHDDAPLRRNLAQRARDRALESYSLRTNIDRLERLYLDLRTTHADAGQMPTPRA
ncbi:MAG: glycosyltransferase family 4 protein [Candidatus Dormibacteria bacterium]